MVPEAINLVEENMEEFAEAIGEKDISRVEALTGEIIREKSERRLDLEDISGLDKELAKEVQIHGFNSVEKLANSSLEELFRIPDLREGKAKKVLESAREHVRNKLTELPGVGKGTAKEMSKRGYATLQDIKGASIEKLTEVPKIGEKGAVKIRGYVEEDAGTDLEDLPGVGKGTAEEMRKSGFTPMQCVAESSIEELTEVPNVGAKGAEKIFEYARDNPRDDLENLPGAGEETVEGLKGHGFTAIRKVADSSVEELKKVPNIGKEGAKKILDYAREKLGGRVEELPELDEEDAEELEERGFLYVGDIASSSVEELVEVPGLKEGRAKKVLEAVREEWQESGEVKGYRRALKGVSSALESDKPLTLAQKIADGKCSEEKLENIKEERASKMSDEFRPPKERGFNEAWRDILEAVLAIEGD